MFPFKAEAEDRPWFWFFAIVAALEALVVALVSFSLADGHFMLPLDDSYIHLQYARQLAAGQPLIYTQGMTPSGGMTSPLYVALLSPLFFLKLQGVKAALASFAFGTLLWMLTPVWVYQLTKRLANCLCGAIAAGLVLANGHLLWNYLSGMETALFTTLLVGALLGAQSFWQSEQSHGKWMLLACAALLPLARPEGIIVPALLVLLLLLRRGEEPRFPLPIALLTFLPFILWLLLLWASTGDWRPAGLVVKGLTAYPYLGPVEKAAIAFDTLNGAITRFYVNIVPDPHYATFKGTISLPYVPIGLLLLTIFGAGFVLVTELRVGRPAGGSLLALGWLLGIASLAGSLLPFIHQQRYLAPWTVPAIILAMMALRRIGQLFQQFEESAVKAGGIGLLLLSLPSVGFWAAEHGRNARDIFHLLRVSTFTLSNETLAITDAGVLAYYTDIRAYDLVGLCSSEFTPLAIQGEGAVLERLATIPRERRPQAVIAYRDWFSPQFPLHDPESEVSIPFTSITSGTSLCRFPFDWPAIDAGREPPAARSVLLDVNVADIASERAAAYEWQFGPYDVDHRRWPQTLSPVLAFTVSDDAETTPAVRRDAVDGARAVRSESFRFAPATRPGPGLNLALRIGKSDFAPLPTALQLTIESEHTSARRDVEIPPFEEAFHAEVPISELLDEVGGTSWKFRLDGLEPGTGWASSHYWILGDTLDE